LLNPGYGVIETREEAQRAEPRALMQMVNELGRDADFDEQSGRQKQQDAWQDGIWRCAFFGLNILYHDHTSA
jgi:hypothetical protein